MTDQNQQPEMSEQAEKLSKLIEDTGAQLLELLQQLPDSDEKDRAIQLLRECYDHAALGVVR